MSRVGKVLRGLSH